MEDCESNPAGADKPPIALSMPAIDRTAKRVGQGLIEYALVIALIAIVIILILAYIGNRINDTFSTLGSTMR